MRGVGGGVEGAVGEMDEKRVMGMMGTGGERGVKRRRDGFGREVKGRRSAENIGGKKATREEQRRR